MIENIGTDSHRRRGTGRALVAGGGHEGCSRDRQGRHGRALAGHSRGGWCWRSGRGGEGAMVCVMVEDTFGT